MALHRCKLAVLDARRLFSGNKIRINTESSTLGAEVTIPLIYLFIVTNIIKPIYYHKLAEVYYY
jgi:hypothetical protein